MASLTKAILLLLIILHIIIGLSVGAAVLSHTLLLDFGDVEAESAGEDACDGGADALAGHTPHASTAKGTS